MLVKRAQIFPLLGAIEKLKEVENISILTKYKILKIQEILIKEGEYNSALIGELAEKYNMDKNGQLTIPPEEVVQVKKQLDEFNNDTFSIPDLQFQIEEFDNINISWKDLQALMIFIKD